MKKMLVAFLSFLIIFQGLSGTTKAESNSIEKIDGVKNNLERSIQDDSKLLMKKISMNPYNRKEVDLVLATYKLQPETIKDIQEYVHKVESGEINSSGIDIYVPVGNSYSSMSISPLATSSTKTYTGYNNKTYYEEVVSYNNTSSWAQIKKSNNWIDYRNKTIEAAGWYGVNFVMDKLTLGIWSIGSIFTSGIPANVETNSEFRHEGRLHENKVKKYTYVVKDGQYYFGSRVEMSMSYFENSIVFPGLTNTIYGKNTSLKSLITPSYDVPDYRAWMYHLNGGFTETIPYYDYYGTRFNSI